MCRIYFYSRPCGRGDGQQILKVYEAKAISTHAPAGGATDCRAVFREPCFISTHAPAGGATAWFRRILHKRIDFYSRPCGRGDEGANRIHFQIGKFLLTPLREGRPPSVCETGRAAAISTHAPAGGATAAADAAVLPAAISTHAPAGGATRGRRSCWSRAALHFYSRPCGRGDPAEIFHYQRR